MRADIKKRAEYEKILPRFITENYRIPTGKFFAYGTDPIPNIRLYKRQPVDK
ncbi:hypothetical protein [Rosenbergiella nectarea]|uniref:hypothetical protein n=1 Tax=Rosenbergiella nectarea TaxID=988801 RepID=UPI001F4D3BE8|nr:hypothetical protein [Rosenbergiella nectarea]